MSEEQPEGQDPPGEDEAGEGEAGEAEAPEAEAEAPEAEAEAPEAEAAEGEVAASGAEEGENEAEATAGEEAAEAQETQEQEPAGSDEPSPVEFTEIEIQTDFTFSPSASNTDIARQLLETLEEGEGGTEEGEEGAEKETAEGEGGEEAEAEQQEEIEIEDWIKETKGKKPKESRAMWDYSLYAPLSMVQEQIVETYEDLVLPMITKLCQPMWDFDLLASASMIQSQVDESYELKLELTSLRCEPMWDYDLSVPPEVAQAQVFVEEKELKYEISSLKCYPMWDYDLNAPIQAIPEEIYWVPSYLNFVGVTRQKFFHIEETPNTKFIQTDLHFDPESIIQPEDLLKEPNEEEEEKRRCYTDPNYVPEEISDIIDDDGAAYPNYFELQKPYKVVGDHCVTEEEEEGGGGGEGEEEESESARAERGSEGEETAEEVTSTEVQTDVGLGELLQSESISSVPEPGDEAEEQAAVGDAEESAPAAEDAEGDETSKGEPDVPWALLSDTAVAPQQFHITTEDDILSTVSLAPTAERQENKFNFAITLGGSVWGFPEYSTEEAPGSGTVLPQGDEFTWVPDSTTPFESSVFTPISEEDALLLESAHGDESLEPATTEETDELTLITEDRELTTSGGPVIEVEITMPSTLGENSTENVPQIEVGVAWEALPESLADGRTPDIIVKTVVEDTKK